MRTAFIILFALLLVGCASSPKSAQLTPEQATSLAIRLAGEKAREQGFYGSFQNGQSANFVAGHWVWHSHVEATSTSRYDATVELAADGSTNQVTVVRHGGLP